MEYYCATEIHEESDILLKYNYVFFFSDIKIDKIFLENKMFITISSAFSFIQKYLVTGYDLVVRRNGIGLEGQSGSDLWKLKTVKELQSVPFRKLFV